VTEAQPPGGKNDSRLMRADKNGLRGLAPRFEEGGGGARSKGGKGERPGRLGKKQDWRQPVGSFETEKGPRKEKKACERKLGGRTKNGKEESPNGEGGKIDACVQEEPVAIPKEGLIRRKSDKAGAWTWHILHLSKGPKRNGGGGGKDSPTEEDSNCRLRNRQKNEGKGGLPGGHPARKYHQRGRAFTANRRQRANERWGLGIKPRPEDEKNPSVKETGEGWGMRVRGDQEGGGRRKGGGGG